MMLGILSVTSATATAKRFVSVRFSPTASCLRLRSMIRYRTLREDSMSGASRDNAEEGVDGILTNAGSGSTPTTTSISLVSLETRRHAVTVPA